MTRLSRLRRAALSALILALSLAGADRLADALYDATRGRGEFCSRCGGSDPRCYICGTGRP